MDKATLSELLVEVRRIEAHRQKGAEKKIKQCYELLLKDLHEFLGVSYAKLAEDDVLTYAILQQKGEFARFLDEVVKKVNNITPKAATEITSVVNDVYELAYNGVVKAVAAADTVGALHTALQALPLVTSEIIKRAVENPISGLTLKDTLEKNRKEIVYNIKREIGTGLTQGDRMSTMAKRITNQVDIDYRKAMTITRTEVHRVREAGNCDSARDISTSLDKGDSGMVMVKIWRTMQDESVRPQRQPYKRKSGVKARKKSTAGLRSSLSGANHVKMEGATVKADEPFNLGGGVYADAPGGSGVAGHDINCRCYVEYDLLTVAEFEKATGKKYKNPLTSEVSSGMMEERKVQFDIKKAKSEYADFLNNSPSANRDILKYYADTTEYLDTNKLKSPFGYSTKADKVLYNTKHPAFKDFDFNIANTHELAHRIDALNCKSWENEDFISAVVKNSIVSEALIHKVQTFVDNNEMSPFFDDVISALSENRVETMTLHETQYWDKLGNKEREIFANMFSLESLNLTNDLKYISDNFPKVFKTYLKMRGGI